MIATIRTRIAPVLTVSLLLLLTACIQRKQSEEIETSGKYLGQTAPSHGCSLFASGVVSTGLDERDLALTPDGKEIFYTIVAPNRFVIMQVKQVDSVWKRPQVAPFSGRHNDLEPFVTPDGSRLYFSSDRPAPQSDSNGYDIWYVDKIDDQWGEPVNIGEPVNTPADEFYPSLTASGVLYYTGQREGGFGNDDIYRALPEDGGFAEPQNLGDQINTPGMDFNAYISPDETYLLFGGWNRPDGLGSGDIYHSRRIDDSTWSAAVNLGEPVNSDMLDFCPTVSPDGSLLFFSSRRTDPELDSIPLLDAGTLRKYSTRAQNGEGDIYWMSASFLDTLNRR